MYLGLDLTAAASRPSAFALVDDAPRLRNVGLIGSNDEIVRLALLYRPAFIAIDAPLFYPQGWHCLDWPCSCGHCQTSPQARRWAEKALAAEGIGLFWTTKRSIIKAMVKRAIELDAALKASGFRSIEVYPYGSKRRLFGERPPKKTTPQGLRWLQERLVSLIQGLEGQENLNHDHLDAIVAAYTAYLFDHSQAEAVGDPQEGVIVLPKGPA